ncbi:RHS repeat-associated core domain-containing protein [Aequorivita antarctica]|uniref:RHS repeat-associated core domain-containing protein n=1 Tax=Aequorivita antarctica TaxID=153266 RepID=A0A5C6YW22_9FLAO|nr:RHS repeat-associated core domain-containing protein [Aequorivita antarctica]TXD71577.1 hypothetical protein ESU54_16270 [Aequorivita antarctica]SRX75279.1 hypothetical protein AEQU3_02273 [Aequorivita antarctica]
MLQPGRHANTSDYRYGFQGQEMDDEIKGEGNSLNYTFRMHDPRVGRFFARDQLEAKYPYLTPYQFSSNQPIHASELEGLESKMELNAMQGRPILEGVPFMNEEQKEEYKAGIKGTALGLLDLLNPVNWWEAGEYMFRDMWDYGTGNGDVFDRSVAEMDALINVFNNYGQLTIEERSRFEANFMASIIFYKKMPKLRVSFINSSGLAKTRAYSYAKLLQQTRSIKKTPRSVTAVYDKSTGRVYLGESGKLKSGDNIHPDLKKILPEKSSEKWDVENCSECDALNQAFSDGVKVQNIEIHTVKIDNRTKGGDIIDFPACENCNTTTKDMINTSNDGG